MTHEPPTTGSASAWVFQINISRGGVPKLAVPEVQADFMGLAGDQQRNLEVHGGLERAVTLFSLELILALQAEGHRIYPGALGENLTLTGLDWLKMVPGARLRLGKEVLVEVTRYISPCSNIAHVFIDSDYSRVSQKRFPGWSRLSARVLQPGTLCVGFPAILCH